MDEKYTIILPLKLNTKLNPGEIFINCCVPSFDKFLDLEKLEEFIIICPKNEITDLKNILSFSKLPFHFVKEEELLNLNVHSYSGWYKQQLLKLLISSIVKTKLYLILDSDVYLTKRFSFENMFHEGKIKYNSESWPDNSPNFSTNTRWWNSSAELLNFPNDILMKEKNLLSVTPVVFETDIVKMIIEDMTKKYNSKWQRNICDLNFTEYTLYWIFCMKNNLTYRYTHEGNPLWRHNLSTNILAYENPEKLLQNVKNSFENNDSYFSTFQSYLQIDRKPFIREIKNQLSKYDAVFLISAMLKPNRQQAFSVKERFDQTIKTVQSVKKKIPNSFCLLIEGSKLTQKEKEIFNLHFDKILEYSDDQEVQKFVNEPRNIGFGEMKLLQKGMEYLNKYFFPYNRTKFIFKLTARYFLNNKFELKNYDIHKFNFHYHFNDSFKVDVYTTGLYTIPVLDKDLFLEILKKTEKTLMTSPANSMIERVFFILIPQMKVQRIETLGLSGQLSYNKSAFSV